jgi:hypothetical protein
MINKSEKNGNIILEFSNGDIDKFNEAMQRYNFKNAQSFIRFATSILLAAQYKSIKIKKNNDFIEVEPADDLINKEAK